MPGRDLRIVEGGFRDLAAEVRAGMEPLQTGEGDGTSGGMEARVARLESDMEHVKKDVAELKSDTKAVRASINGLDVKFAGFERELAHRPTTTMMWAATFTGVGVVSAIVALIVRFLPAAG